MKGRERGSRMVVAKCKRCGHEVYAQVNPSSKEEYDKSLCKACDPKHGLWNRVSRAE